MSGSTISEGQGVITPEDRDNLVAVIRYLLYPPEVIVDRLVGRLVAEAYERGRAAAESDDSMVES